MLNGHKFQNVIIRKKQNCTKRLQDSNCSLLPVTTMILVVCLIVKDSVPISQVEFYNLHQFKDNGHYTLTVWYIHVGPEIYQVVCAEISIITFLQKQSSNQIKINTTHHRAVYRESQM